MNYIQTLLERNKANKAKKDAVMPTREEEPDEAGEHSSPTKATGGTQRGVKKVRGERPPREGEAPTTRGHMGGVPIRNIPKKSAMTRPRMAGPRRKLPDHTVYHDMGYLMAESLGLVSEARMTAIRLRKTGGAPLTPEEAMRARRATQKADAKLKAQNKENMGRGILSSRVSQSNKSGT